MTKDIAVRERFLELRAEGWSFERIATELEVSKQTLIAWSKEMETELANLKAIRLEGLQEQYHVLRAKRIELFGKKLQAIMDELEKRDLSDVPTERLFDLVLKYGRALKDDEYVLTFSATEKQTFDDLLQSVSGDTERTIRWTA